MKTASIREIILFGTCLILAFFVFIKGCKSAKETEILLNEVSSYKDSARFYKTKVNGNVIDVAFNKSLILETKKQLESVVLKNDTLLKLISQFKTLKSSTIIKEYFNVRNDTIRIENKIPISFTPFKVKRDSIYYYFSGTIAPDYFSIDTLIIPNKQSVVIGTKKLGFFKGREQRVEIINSNPMLKIEKIQNYVIEDKKKFYEKTWFKFSVGLISGIIIADRLSN